jgi:hypothetical protein
MITDRGPNVGNRCVTTNGEPGAEATGRNCLIGSGKHHTFAGWFARLDALSSFVWRIERNAPDGCLGFLLNQIFCFTRSVPMGE